MYQDYYGLRELPFELTPNPKYLILTGRHREALSTLEYGLSTAKGITTLLGEAGTGKTTLLHAALQSDRCRNVKCVYLVNPTLTRDEFIEMLSARFGLSARAARSKTVLLQELETTLRERRDRGQITALVIDEAQSLSAELLEEIRLMANTETTTEKLLPLVLAGQPELRDRLNEEGLRQLKQRVNLSCEITPFTQHETAAYIAQRIRTAGGEAARLFTREAVMLIHQHSRGIPRTISVICDNALLTALGLGRQRVDSQIVLEVARDFDLGVTRRDLMVAEPEEARAVPAEMFDETPADVFSIGAADAGQESPTASVEHEQTLVDEPPMFATRTRRRFSFFGR
jgi:type II secretory pathway predicted ATPase ExeA